MIRHRPYGSEHPYALTADQRIPARPGVGDQLTLGVAGASMVASVTCLWTATQPDGTGATEKLPLTPQHLPKSDGAPQMVGGHLAAAQAKAQRSGGRIWQVRTPPLEADMLYHYAFVARDQTGRRRRTRSYTVVPAQWSTQSGGSTLAITSDRLVRDEVQWRRSGTSVDRVRFALRLEPGERVVGFGERFDYLDQRGHALDAVVFEQYKSQAAFHRTYLPMPFAHVISAGPGEGWGFHVRSSRRSYYDVAASTTDRLVVEVELGGAEVEALDVAVYRGAPTDVLNSFLAETGRPEELPDWVFGLWASGNEWNTQDLVMQRMNSHLEHDIPVGAVVIEAWSDEEGITIFRDASYSVNEDGAAHVGADFTYQGAWPDPAGMIAELHSRGIKVVLWQIPLQKMRPHSRGQARADAAALLREHHAVLEADGRPYRNRGWWFPQALMPDLSVQRTRDWWTDKRRYLVKDFDVDGFKTDGGEHAWGHDLRYADGRRGDEGNNLFPVHYARAFGDLLRSEGKAPVTFSRSGFTGTQAHGIVWAGDENSTWEAFRASITAGLTASACGILYWSWDLAGFSGPVPGAELYLRATAAATFMPVMQYHSEFNHNKRPLRDRTPWHVQTTTGDLRVLPTFCRYAQLRERLVPYLAEQARSTIRTARPLMRALFFDYPEDPQVWDHPHQYLLGDDLLINPVTRPDQLAWTTYLPAGTWIDAWTGQQVNGGRSQTRPVPIEELPVFCRAESWPKLQAVFPNSFS